VNKEVKRDWAWADTYLPEIKRVLRTLAHRIITISIASDEDDTKYATDYRVTVEAGSVACRVRRPNCSYRDFTLRHSRPSGVETEEQKILAGYCRWYLYAWAQDARRFAEWIFVDLDRLRECDIIAMAPLGTNPDGVRFRIIDLQALELYDCLVAHEKVKRAA
jgi:hypothetical protein